MTRILLSVSCIAAAVSAQSLSGPILGWSVASGDSVRTIYGVPGAARSTGVAKLPPGIHVLRMNPASSSALAAAGDSGALAIYDLATGDATPLAGAMTNPTLEEFSPRGAALVLLNSAGQAQVYTRDIHGFSLRDSFDLPAGRLAVSDDGAAVLAERGGALVLRTAGSETTLVAAPVDSFTFLAGAATPVFHAANQLVIGANSLPLDGAVQLASPAAGRVLALRGGTRLTLFDASGSTIADEDIGGSATGFAAVGRPDTVELRGASGNLLWFYDASVPRRFFVPVPQPHIFRRAQEGQ